MIFNVYDLKNKSHHQKVTTDSLKDKYTDSHYGDISYDGSHKFPSVYVGNSLSKCLIVHYIILFAIIESF